MYDDKEHPVLVNSLVDFQRKAIDEINEDRLKEPEDREPGYSVNEEDWAEFTDSLGRTRRCLKADLPEFLGRDAYAELNPAAASTASISLDEKVRLEKHEKWEKEEAELVEKPDVHYQDVLYDGKLDILPHLDFQQQTLYYLFIVYYFYRAYFQIR
jgi:hypothetical protein